GLRVKLERKPLQLLTSLIERAGEVVTRHELQHLMWGEDLFVDFDKSLNVAAAKLRAALNDSAENPKYIQTVSREGYRFINNVDQVFATPPVSAFIDTRIPEAQQTSIGLPTAEISTVLPQSQPVVHNPLSSPKLSVWRCL